MEISTPITQIAPNIHAVYVIHEDYILKQFPEGLRGQHGAHLGPVDPRWAPCWPHKLCYQG